MELTTTRINAVRQALTADLTVGASVNSKQLDLLTQYMLGHLSLAQTNELLAKHGGILVAN